MKDGSLNYYILLSFAWLSLYLEKLNREKVVSYAKLQEFTLSLLNKTLTESWYVLQVSFR